MPDYTRFLSELRRPGILMRAVRFGLADYQRGRLLGRLIPGETSPDVTIPRLIAAEARLEETRRRGDAGYSISDHVEILVALIAETSLLRAPVVF